MIDNLGAFCVPVNLQKIVLYYLSYSASSGSLLAQTRSYLTTNDMDRDTLHADQINMRRLIFYTYSVDTCFPTMSSDMYNDCALLVDVEYLRLLDLFFCPIFLLLLNFPPRGLLCTV